MSTAPPPRKVPRAAAIGGGVAMLGLGLALLVLPGPGIPFVLGGAYLILREVPAARPLVERIDGVARRARQKLPFRRG